MLSPSKGYTLQEINPGPAEGVIGFGEGVMYLTSLGHPTDGNVIIPVLFQEKAVILGYASPHPPHPPPLPVHMSFYMSHYCS